MGREIIVALHVTRPFGVLTNDLVPQLVRDSKACDRSQPRDPRRPVRVFRFARTSPIARDVALNISRDHSIHSNPSGSSNSLGRANGSTRDAPSRRDLPANLLLELVELMGIEPMTS